MSSQQHHQLLSLYVSVLVPILSDWINDEDLCYLDTAVCCHKLRNSFERLMEQCSIINTDLTRKGCAFQLFKCWMLLRGLGLKEYNVNRKVSPEEAQLLFKSKHLIHLESENCNQLTHFLSQIPITAHSINVLYDAGDSLKTIGNVITNVVMRDWLRDISFVKDCPILRSLKGLSWSTVLYAINHCPQLDIIYSCRFTGLIESTNAVRFYCDFKRTTVVDESAVCLKEILEEDYEIEEDEEDEVNGWEERQEKKYFNLTGLNKCDFFNEMDCIKLSPLLKHLTRIYYCDQRFLLPILAIQCYNLTYLEVLVEPESQQDVLCLLSHSPKLREFILIPSSWLPADPFISILSLHCPLLEVFICEGEHIEEPELLCSLFERCSLTKFSFNKRYLTIQSKSGFMSGRPIGSLILWSAKHEDVVATLLKCYSHIYSIECGNYSWCTEEKYNFVLKSLPQLTSVTISAYSERLNFEGLRGLNNLTALSLLNVVSIAMFRNKSRLKLLVLNNCNCDGAMLSEIAAYCPNLTRLELTRNREIKYEDIPMLFDVYTKLEQVDVSMCRNFEDCIITRKIRW